MYIHPDPTYLCLNVHIYEWVHLGTLLVSTYVRYIEICSGLLILNPVCVFNTRLSWVHTFLGTDYHTGSISMTSITTFLVVMEIYLILPNIDKIL
jgi:hypothetical protein